MIEVRSYASICVTEPSLPCGPMIIQSKHFSVGKVLSFLGFSGIFVFCGASAASLSFQLEVNVAGITVSSSLGKSDSRRELPMTRKHLVVGRLGWNVG